jgi:hypothetical protein
LIVSTTSVASVTDNQTHKLTKASPEAPEKTKKDKTYFSLLKITFTVETACRSLPHPTPYGRSPSQEGIMSFDKFAVTVYR